MTSADSFVMVKMAVSELARRHGMIGTFMPKPFSNRTGSGAHFHISLGNAQTPNLFFDANDPQGLKLSEMAYFFLGGILKHARALTAICAPTVNSYKRLVVGRALSGATWAPAYIAYGDNNRTSCVRIPGGRLEMRLPDAGCNPYLATAAIVAAGMDGVKQRIHPGKANNSNLYEATPEELKKAGIDVLPQNLLEAVQALEADEVVREGLGKELAAEFIALKRMEWTEYARHVSDWETERYLEFF
jgi:glutamine synthetase